MVKLFNTYGEFLAALQRPENLRATRFMAGVHHGLSWYDGLTYERAVECARDGDASNVVSAQAMLDKLDVAVEVPPVRDWTACCAGAYPVVPEALLGLPQPMRLKQECEQEYAPVRVFVSLTCSGGLSADEMRNRGVAILALVLKLQSVRPVDVYIVNEMHGVTTGGRCVIATPLDSRPLDLARACYVLTHVGFVRRVMYHLSVLWDDCNGGWPDGWGSSEYDQWRNGPECLDLQPMDCYIPPAHLDDSALLSDPVAWVRAKFTQLTSDIYEGGV